MKILLIGASGQLGQELFPLINNDRNLFILTPSSKELNLLNKKLIEDYIDSNKPDLVINLSAYTNVDLAEIESNLAMKINFEGIKDLGCICSLYLIPLIHISTDYVFGDKSSGPHKINDIHDPINVYGKSKSLGEEFLLKNCDKTIIIRTASLYGLYGKNFFKTFIDILNKEKEINVVNDQSISLTWTYDLSVAILQLINLFRRNNNISNIGNNTILHIVNKGFTNWYDVASKIAEYMLKVNNDSERLIVNPVDSKEWGAKANRSKDSRLKSYGKILGDELMMPEWSISLNNVLDLYFSGDRIG